MFIYSFIILSRGNAHLEEFRGAAKMIGAATAISTGTRKRELVKSHTMIT
jgi:hypothetical protein